jgi:hypothetical protein
MISRLKIFPLAKPRDPDKRSYDPLTLAKFEAVLEIGIIIYGKIIEGRQGIRAEFKNIGFDTDAVRKQLENRVLSTWVINPCVSEYQA